MRGEDDIGRPFKISRRINDTAGSWCPAVLRGDARCLANRESDFRTPMNPRTMLREDGAEAPSATHSTAAPNGAGSLSRTLPGRSAVLVPRIRRPGPVAGPLPVVALEPFVDDDGRFPRNDTQADGRQEQRRGPVSQDQAAFAKPENARGGNRSAGSEHPQHSAGPNEEDH